MTYIESKLKQAHEKGVPVIVGVCTMGTTDSMVFDQVHALIQKYPNPEGFECPHIYCDTVARWAFLPFNQYDFEKNPKDSSPDVVSLLVVFTVPDCTM